MSHSFIFRVLVNPAPVSTTAGSDFSITVDVQAIDQTTGAAINTAFVGYQWKRDDGDPLPASATENGNTLSFSAADASDTGYYYCVVTLNDYNGAAEPGFPYQISSDEAYVLVSSALTVTTPTDGVTGETGVNNGRALTEVLPQELGLSVTAHGAGKGGDGIVQRQYPVTVDVPVLVQVVLSGQIEAAETAVFYADGNAFVVNQASVDQTGIERFVIDGGKLNNAGTSDLTTSDIAITGLYDTGHSTARFSVEIKGSFYAWVWRIDADPYKPIFNRNNNVIETGWLTPGRHTLHIGLWDEGNTLLDYDSREFSIRTADVREAEKLLPSTYTPKAITDPTAPAVVAMAPEEEGSRRRAGDISLRNFTEVAPGQVLVGVGLNWGHVTWAYQVNKEPIVQVPEGVLSVTLNLASRPGNHVITVVGIGPDGFEAGASRASSIRIQPLQEIRLLATMQEQDGAVTFYVELSSQADQWMYRLDAASAWSFVSPDDNAVTLSVSPGHHKIQLAQLRHNAMIGGVTEHYFSSTPEALNSVKVFQMLSTGEGRLEVHVTLDPQIHFGWRWRLNGGHATTVRDASSCVLGPIERGKHKLEVWGLGPNDRQVGPVEAYPISI